MSEVLSQSEIDALLAALSTGDVTAEEMKKEEKQRKIKIYDFKRPDKFSKDQIRTLQMVHESFARLFSTSLATFLRTLVQIDVISVDQLTYEEFVKCISNPTIMTIFEMKPLKNTAIFEINPSVIFPIIDRLLGGPGTSQEKIRELSEIERTIAERIVYRALENFKEAWRNVIELNTEIERIETNPLFTQIVSPNDMVVVITFETKIRDNKGMLNICIPYVVLEPIMSRLSAHYWFSSIKKAATTESFASVRDRVEKAKVPLVVQLGNAFLSVRDVLNIQAGDVIQLDGNVKSELEIKVGNRTKFRGHPGVVGSKLAMQITSVVPEGEDDGNE